MRSVPPFQLLFVDDDPMTLDLLHAVFEDDDRFEAQSARTGDDAIRMCRQAPPDLMILDVRLQRSDGYRVCRLVKHDPACESVQVVFLSGLPPTPPDLWRKLGAQEFLTKPVPAGELVNTVERCLGLAQAA